MYYIAKRSAGSVVFISSKFFERTSPIDQNKGWKVTSRFYSSLLFQVGEAPSQTVSKMAFFYPEYYCSHSAHSKTL
jgi:hypothetical protein